MRYTDIRFWMVTLLFLLMAGCSDDNAPVKSPVETDYSSFMMYVYMPNGETRSAEDDRSIYIDRPFEGTVNSLHVWILARDTNNQLIEITEEAASNGVLYDNVGSIDSSVTVKQVAFNVASDFKNNYPYLDVYVIANIESLGKNESWCYPKARDVESLQEIENRLESLQLLSDQFGVGDNMVSDASTYGLPMSGYLKHASVTKQGVLFSTMSIKVKRAVSKLRFVFSKSNITPDAQVTSVKLNTNMIPDKGYLFRGTAAENGVSLNETGYTSSFYGVIDFGAPASINTNMMPSSLKWDAYTSRQQWEDAINAAIKNGEATEFVRAYLHESPQRLTGTIKYKMTALGEEKSIAFTMAEGNHFLRNRSWTVYAFFSRGGLVYEVADWEDEEVTFKPFI